MNVLVVDDEPLARRRLLRLLADEPGVRIAGEVGDGAQAARMIVERRPDLVFLDVQMPEVDGFRVLELVGPERMPPVIFVTAYDQYAVRAFDVHALDYLLKPYDEERFRRAFARARQQLARGAPDDARTERLRALVAELGRDLGLGTGESERPTTIQGPLSAAPSPQSPVPASQFLTRLLVKHDGRVFFVKAEEIDWIEAAGNYAKLHVGKTEHLLRETMAALEERLDPSRFLRIHRGTIVNLDRVREMQPWFSGEYIVILHDGTKLKLSRRYRDRMPERLGQEL